MGQMASRMQESVGYSEQDIDGCFKTVRTQESNLGNFVCDILRKATDTDVVIINGGECRESVEGYIKGSDFSLFTCPYMSLLRLWMDRMDGIVCRDLPV